MIWECLYYQQLFYISFQNPKEVFPECQVKQTNAQLKTININRRKRHASLTCRSLYGTLNGACDCDGFCVSDDLIGGIEEALNKDRLISAWSKVDNNLLPRAKEQAKIMWFGTWWSLADPIGIRTELLTNEKAFEQRRYKKRSVRQDGIKQKSNDSEVLKTQEVTNYA